MTGFARYTNVRITSGNINHISLVLLMSADARIARFDTRSNSKVSATEPKRADLTDEMSFVLTAWRSQRFTANIPTDRSHGKLPVGQLVFACENNEREPSGGDQAKVIALRSIWKEVAKSRVPSLSNNGNRSDGELIAVSIADTIAGRYTGLSVAWVQEPRQILTFRRSWQ